MEKLGRPAVTACPQLPVHPLVLPERASASRRWIEAKGVATSVNATVVLGVVACFVINVFITQLTTMFVPQTIG